MSAGPAPAGTRTSSGAPRVLILTLAVDYTAPARLPWELRQAGCRVAVIAPAGALATRTPHVDRRTIATGDETLAAWTALVDREIAAFDPAIVLPGDDAMLRALLGVALEPPPGSDAARLARRTALLTASLGPLDRVVASIDKTRLFELARDVGLAVADGGIATSTGEAIELADGLGYPVIVRAGFGTGGSGSARCASSTEVRDALRSARRPRGWLPDGPMRHLVQRWIDGPVMVRASLAWRGAEIAGTTRGRLATYPGPLGPGSAVAYEGLPEVAAATRTLLVALGASGYVGTQFILEPGSGRPLLLEINRRMVPATYGSSYAGIDLARALAATLRGEAWNGPDDLPSGPGPRLALFPQEWYRDPESAWLADLPSDAPWHDPALFRAMLRLPVDADRDALEGGRAPSLPRR